MGQKMAKNLRKKVGVLSSNSTSPDNSIMFPSEGHYRFPKIDKDFNYIQIYFYLHRYLWQGCYSVPFEFTTKAYVLDVGYGSKFWLNEIGLEHPNSEFIGIDLLSPCEMPLQTVPNVEYIEADLQQLPFEKDTLDFVRFFETGLLVAGNDWNKVLTEVTRVLKPGGYIQIDEADFPPLKCGPIFGKIYENWLEILEQFGTQPRLANRLELYLASINEIEDVNCDQITIPIGPRGGKIGRCQARVTFQFFKGEFVPTLADHMGISEQDYQELLDLAIDELKEYDTHFQSRRFWGRKALQEKN